MNCGMPRHNSRNAIDAMKTISIRTSDAEDWTVAYDAQCHTAFYREFCLRTNRDKVKRETYPGGVTLICNSDWQAIQYMAWLQDQGLDALLEE